MAYKIKDKDGRPVVTKGGENVLGADNHEVFELKDFSNKERSFLAVASTDSPDRFKDIITVEGWDLKNYRKNPVLMAFHAYHTLPVGRSLEEFSDTKGKVNRLMFRPQFATYPDTMRMYEMYRDGFLKGFSVGFIPKKSEEIKNDKKKNDDDHPFFHRPTRFLKQELLENSVAPIPANPEALSEIKVMVKNGSIYIPARYLQEEQKPELEAFDNYIHVKVEDESRFTELFEDEVAQGVIRVFGRVKTEDEDELIDHKYIFVKATVKDGVPYGYTEEQAMDCISLYAEEAYPSGETTIKIYDPEAYTVKETVLVEALPVLDEEAFEAKRKELDVGDANNDTDTNDDETECDCQEELDKEYVIGKDIDFSDEDFITEEDVEEKPYPNEHACRLLPPTGFTSYARKSCFRKSGGKCIDFIFGIKGGKSKTQAMRYKKSIWTAAGARSHCSGAGGSFEAAGKEMSEADSISVILEDFGSLCEKLKNTLLTIPVQVVLETTVNDGVDVDDDTEEKRIGGNKNLPTDPEADWDTRAVLNRMRKWSGGPDEAEIDWKKYKQGFVWYDNADPKNFESYKLPFADVIDGALKAKWGGIYRAMALVLGARGGVDITETERKRAYKFLKIYYEKFEKPIPDYKDISEDPMIFEMRSLMKEFTETMIDEVVDRVIRAVRNTLQEEADKLAEELAQDEEIMDHDEIDLEIEEEEETEKDKEENENENEDEIDVSEDDVKTIVSSSLKEALGQLD